MPMRTSSPLPTSPPTIPRSCAYALGITGAVADNGATAVATADIGPYCGQRTPTASNQTTSRSFPSQLLAPVLCLRSEHQRRSFAAAAATATASVDTGPDRALNVEIPSDRRHPPDDFHRNSFPFSNYALGITSAPVAATSTTATTPVDTGTDYGQRANAIKQAASGPYPSQLPPRSFDYALGITGVPVAATGATATAPVGHQARHYGQIQGHQTQAASGPLPSQLPTWICYYALGITSAPITAAGARYHYRSSGHRARLQSTPMPSDRRHPN